LYAAYLDDPANAGMGRAAQREGRRMKIPGLAQLAADVKRIADALERLAKAAERLGADDEAMARRPKTVV
jgi:hypothetical protein